MKHLAVLFSGLLVLTCNAYAGELYRWVDDRGRVHYTDTPPANAAKLERKKLSGEVDVEEDIPYEARLAQQNFPVTLYVSDTCTQPCEQGRKLLKKRGVPFKEVMLKTKSEIDAFQKKSGSSDAPTLAVGKKYLGGYFESRWNSELDIAGYPKTATYRQSIAPAPTATTPSGTKAGRPEPASESAVEATEPDAQ